MKLINSITGSVFIILIVVFVLYQGSSEYLSAGRFSQILAIGLQKFIKVETGNVERSISDIELILRKLAHLLEYLALGTVTFGIVNRVITRRWIAFLCILLITLPIPFIDEFFIQARTLGRASQLLDVIIDIIGIAISIGIGLFYELLWHFHEGKG